MIVFVNRGKSYPQKAIGFLGVCQVASIWIFCYIRFRHQSIKVTLIIFVLNDALLFKFTFRKRLGYGYCAFSLVLQNLSIVELQKCVQLRCPVFHRHRNMTFGLPRRIRGTATMASSIHPLLRRWCHR